MKKSKYFSAKTIINPCIYFLFLNGELVYIGKTINLQTRLVTHLRDKVFDSYRYIECPQDRLNHYELRWIKRFKPPLNMYVAHVRPKVTKEFAGIREYLMQEKSGNPA